MVQMKKVLIAGRGEIAVRVARACRVLGLGSVAIYSDADETARHVRKADEAVRVGSAPAAASYLDIAAILAAARCTGADAVHPCYGFLSENAEFAEAVAAAGLTWIGPPAAVMAPIHSKSAAKQMARAAGVPTAASVALEDLSPAGLRAAAAQVGFPLLVKPEDGGGGKGMQRVDCLDDLWCAVEASQRTAASAFGSDRLLLERCIDGARHVEVQVLGDQHGEVAHLFERDCSIQRRHQKVLEESPCSILTPDERAAICASGLTFAKHVGYIGAGTVEFLFDPRTRAHYFLEMNARLQVEHAVTEQVLGIDLVVAQLRIAQGALLADILAGLSLGQRGHAMEARVYAEDPAQAYVPQAGMLRRVIWPDAPMVRVDAGFETGDAVPEHYDPLLAKIIAWGRDREEAKGRLLAALRETVVHGVTTNIPLLMDVLQQPGFDACVVHTGWLDDVYGVAGPGPGSAVQPESLLALAVGGPGRQTAHVAIGADGAALRDPWDVLAGLRVGGGRP